MPSDSMVLICSPKSKNCLQGAAEGLNQAICCSYPAGSGPGFLGEHRTRIQAWAEPQSTFVQVLHCTKVVIQRHAAVSIKQADAPSNVHSGAPQASYNSELTVKTHFSFCDFQHQGEPVFQHLLIRNGAHRCFPGEMSRGVTETVHFRDSAEI